MQWVRRGGHPPPDASEADAGAVRAAPRPAGRAAPGLAALFEGVTPDRSHAVLDLGAAADSSLRVYSRFARWVGFADALAVPGSPDGREALASIPSAPGKGYDLVVGWDVLDRVSPAARPGFVKGLAEIVTPRARMFLMLESPDVRAVEVLRFAVTDVGQMSSEVTGAPRPGYPPVPPGELKRLLEPFQVARAFSTRSGLREYLAVR